MKVSTRLAEIKKELHKDSYNIFLSIVHDDLSFGLSVGSNYTDEKVVEIMNTALVVINRTCLAATK